jgi:hypothetical protein
MQVQVRDAVHFTLPDELRPIFRPRQAYKQEADEQ